MFLFVLGAVEVLRVAARHQWHARATLAAFTLLHPLLGWNQLLVRTGALRAVVEHARLTDHTCVAFEGGHPLLRHPTAPEDSYLFVVRASPLHGDILLLEKGQAQMPLASWSGKDDFAGWLCLSLCAASLLLAFGLATRDTNVASDS